MLKTCLRPLGILATVLSLVACQGDNKLDLESLNVANINQFNASSRGYVITEHNDLLAIPEFIQEIHRLSASLADQHWLKNPKFIAQANSLRVHFQASELHEAKIFIAALDEAISQYSSNIAKVNALANVKQREIDADLIAYQATLNDLEHTLAILKTPIHEYETRLDKLSDAITDESRHFAKLRNDFQASFRELDSDDHPMAYDIRFSYVQQPRSMCSRFDEMRELITTLDEGCTYVNREELLDEISTTSHPQAEQLIDYYAPLLWLSMTKLSGFFDTNYNTQFFPHNLRHLHTKTKIALNEKRILMQGNTRKMLEDYEYRLAQLKNEHTRNIPYDFVDEQFTVDTNSDAFVHYFEQYAAENNYSLYQPIDRFKELINDQAAIKQFTSAYAKKTLNNYPTTLTFQVTGRGYYNVPSREKAIGIIFDFYHSEQHMILCNRAREELPVIVTEHTADFHHIEGVSLVTELDRRLQAFILS
ncbi:hypothetical protein [Photobacterium sanguinicancri]|uniref:hypothetical protein n=1 Tax=Photobacterium sanguinicancri TaxID=875932 RepID=UPI0026E270C4|nr:hypothetical protein [Photobacterium sanguinicancri]MDO6498029.1 hypothetical protein [Photobacterium sanguinicancri]